MIRARLLPLLAAFTLGVAGVASAVALHRHGGASSSSQRVFEYPAGSSGALSGH